MFYTTRVDIGDACKNETKCMIHMKEAKLLILTNLVILKNRLSHSDHHVLIILS